MYRIVAHCDPYNACRYYRNEEVIKEDGATPVAWVIETFETKKEARERLWKMALEDAGEHFANLTHEDDESIADMKQMLIDDEGLSESDVNGIFSWYRGEGVYTNESHEIVLLKGGSAYSYDVMTYMIEDDE